jgi:hypothetical protein
MCKIFPALEFTANILQLTQYLIQSILDLLKENGTGTSQATFNKLLLHRDISRGRKNLQNLVNSTVELFHVHRQRWRSERQAALLHSCVICIRVHTQLTSGSATIFGNVIGSGSSSLSASEAASAFIFMA